MEFKDRDIEAFWNDPDANIPRRVPPNCRKTLYRKLQILDAATSLLDLKDSSKQPLGEAQRKSRRTIQHPR